MDTSTAELVKNIVGTIVRSILFLVAGIFIKKGILTTEQSETYIAQGLPVVVGAVMALVALVWGIWQKKHANDKVDTALTLQAGTSRETLEKKV